MSGCAVALLQATCYLRVMRIGYGYMRREADFAGLNIDRLWLDGGKTERAERGAMLKAGIRRGDTVVLLSRGDLSHGKHINEVERMIRDAGASIEVNEQIRPRGRPGPKPLWEPKDEARLSLLWHDETVDGPYVVRLACEDAGLKPTPENRELMRGRMNRRFGTRSKKEKS